MSGGVDSTVSALLLRDHYRIDGFFMRLAQPDFDHDKRRVEAIAARIGIPLHVIDCRKSFEEKVLAYFTESYFDGLTPNPCMRCNREIKFGLLMETMLSCGMDGIATGHYARIETREDGRHLCRGKDPAKDQSYFLARLTQEQLKRILFPLGEMIKKETYRIAERYGFTDFQGRESQDVCFLGRNELAEFLKKRRTDITGQGPITTDDGRILGSHKGLFRYTVGQRRGLGLPDASPWYVLDIDIAGNRLIVGKKSELYQDRLMLRRMHWLSGKPPADSAGYQVRIRSTHRGAEATIRLEADNRCEITFREKQRAVTPGQFAVIYKECEVIGSGEIFRNIGTEK